MEKIKSAKIKYIQSLLAPLSVDNDRIDAEEKLVSAAKDYAKNSKTPETDFLLGYFGLFFGDDYQIPFDKALEHLEASDKAGNQDASVVLAQLYMGHFDFLTEKFIEEAGDLEFLSKKANYIKPSKGILLLENLALSGHPHAMYLYALSYADNLYSDEDEEQPCFRDEKRALEYAAKCKAIEYIGGYYLEGLWLFESGPGPKDPKRAVEIWEEGYRNATINNMFSIPIFHDICYALGYAYSEGIGVKEDNEKGLELIKKAADGGHEDAINWHRQENMLSVDDQTEEGSQETNPLSYFLGKRGQDHDLFSQKIETGEDHDSLYNFSSPYSGKTNIKEDGNGYYIVEHPEQDDHKPPIRVRIHYPDERNEAYKNYLNESEEKQKELMDSLLEPLSRLPGLCSIKSEIESMVNYAFIVQKRKELELKTRVTGSHMLFLGNPGTGKTLIARLLGNIFYQIGLLEKGHVVEADQNVLTGEYIGWTASKTNLACNTAIDGILFIDEAYALTDSANSSYDFGIEAINSLMKFMEDFSDRFIVIAAGYKDKMEEFIRSNPGLRSRFSQHIEFKDYKPDDMVKIFEIFASDNDYALTSNAKKKLLLHLKSIKGNDIGRFANARGVRNLFDDTIKRQSERLIKEKSLNKEKMMEIIADDIPSDKAIEDGNVTHFPNKRDT